MEKGGFALRGPPFFMRNEKNALHTILAFLKEGINQGAMPHQQGVYHE